MFRYGAVVMIGLDAALEDQVVEQILPQVQGLLVPREDEVIELSTGDAREDAASLGGAFPVGPLSSDTLLVVADALAKSVAVAQNERQIAEVFDTVEPWAQKLAAGRIPGGRRDMARQIGRALLVQHRLAERVAVQEKPDILWDRPDLERLYARLESEYELTERSEALARKLDLIGETATVMTDLIDTRRALGLEATVVALIVAEIGLTLFEMVRG